MKLKENNEDEDMEIIDGEEIYYNGQISDKQKKRIEKAKRREIVFWKENKVYEEVNKE